MIFQVDFPVSPVSLFLLGPLLGEICFNTNISFLKTRFSTTISWSPHFACLPWAKYCQRWTVGLAMIGKFQIACRWIISFVFQSDFCIKLIKSTCIFLALRLFTSTLENWCLLLCGHRLVDFWLCFIASLWESSICCIWSFRRQFWHLYYCSVL